MRRRCRGCAASPCRMLPRALGNIEAVIRLLRAATEADARATVLSVDAVGAFDHVAHRSMLAVGAVGVATCYPTRARSRLRRAAITGMPAPSQRRGARRPPDACPFSLAIQPALCKTCWRTGGQFSPSLTTSMSSHAQNVRSPCMTRSGRRCGRTRGLS